MANTVFVLAMDGTKLMPTSPKKARILLKKKEAKIFKYDPFAIKLTRESEHNVQGVEMCVDTGSKHFGISIKSNKHEYTHAQYDNLPDEKKKHEEKKRHHNSRKNRLRYRESRFDNRVSNKKEGWLAPSLAHKKDNHLKTIKKYCEVCPITSITLEMGTFDTHAMRAYEQYSKILEGTDYQKGERYGFETLRAAVFYRDNYTCKCCEKTMKEGAIFNVHHIGYWKDDRTNRLSNLLTVCTKCHTPKNHQKGGKLYGFEPKTYNLSDAAYMNTVRKYLYLDVKKEFKDIEINTTYGVDTKLARKELHLNKSHANDAYSMGKYHPKHRTKEEHYIKRRRNNRALSTFHDAIYIDVRDGKKKKGKELSCNRTKRYQHRNSEKNERIYRGKKIAKGRVQIRKQYYSIKAGDQILYKGKRYHSRGMCNYGRYIKVGKNERLPSRDIKVIYHANGWIKAK